MANKIPIIIYPVKDIEKAEKYYSTFLGTEPYVNSPYYVGYKLADLEFGLAAGPGVVTYIDVDDIEESIKTLKTAGAEVVSDAKNVGGGLLVAQLKDTEGNMVGFRQQPK